MRQKTLAVLFGVSLALAQNALAQNYPSRTITIIVPQAAGGPGDVMARFLAQAMGKTLKQTVIVENIGGAGGNIGVARAAKAAPDGYMLLLHHIGMATSPALYRTLQYDPVADLEPIGLVADVPLMLIARGNVPASNLHEFISYVKANKNKVSYSNAGLGSASHLCGLLFMQAIQTEVTTVPYKGTAPAMNDLLGGQVDFMCDAQTPASAGNIRVGRIKVYGVTTLTRVSSLPDVPTLDEQGLKGFEAIVWRGLYAPRGTPKPALDSLVVSLQQALRDPDFRASLAKLGTEPVSEARATPEALRAKLKSEIDKWGAVIRKAGKYAD